MRASESVCLLAAYCWALGTWSSTQQFVVSVARSARPASAGGSSPPVVGQCMDIVLIECDLVARKEDDAGHDALNAHHISPGVCEGHHAPPWASQLQTHERLDQALVCLQPGFVLSWLVLAPNVG